jgi:hypothetical protein
MREVGVLACVAVIVGDGVEFPPGRCRAMEVVVGVSDSLGCASGEALPLQAASARIISNHRRATAFIQEYNTTNHRRSNPVKQDAQEITSPDA